tara:strand:- start:142 stop:507 length:366 start_codon:yes stop_codon:yes gene_type:complete
MPTITMQFSEPLNVSIQVGDIAYYCLTTLLGTHDTASQPDIIQIGDIISIVHHNNIIICNWSPNPTSAPYPTQEHFIMFSKDNKVNLSSILGYYAEVKFKNNSPDKAELFSVGSEMFVSSK